MLPHVHPVVLELIAKVELVHVLNVLKIISLNGRHIPVHLATI
jgi:hypothetical protein